MTKEGSKWCTVPLKPTEEDGEKATVSLYTIAAAAAAKETNAALVAASSELNWHFHTKRRAKNGTVGCFRWKRCFHFTPSFSKNLAKHCGV